MGLSSLGGGRLRSLPKTFLEFVSSLEALAFPEPKPEAWIFATMRMGVGGWGCPGLTAQVHPPGHPVPSCSVHLLTSGNHRHWLFLSQPQLIHTPLLILEFQAALPGRNKCCCPVHGGRNGGCREVPLTAEFCRYHALPGLKHSWPPSMWQERYGGPQQLWGILLCVVL